MRFEALTNAAHIDAGTQLLIIEVPTIEGTQPRALWKGATLDIEFYDSSRTKAIVTAIDANGADIQLADNTSWRMTPHAASDYPIGIKADWAHRQEWVIRSAIVEVHDPGA